MLTIQDCLDYCDLTEAEVELFAEYECIPKEIAGPMVCGLVQSDEGIELVCDRLSRLLSDAMNRGAIDKAQHVLQVYSDFRSAHPLPQ